MGCRSLKKIKPMERVGTGRRRCHSWKGWALAGDRGTIVKGGHWQEKVAQFEKEVISRKRGHNWKGWALAE